MHHTQIKLVIFSLLPREKQAWNIHNAHVMMQKLGLWANRVTTTSLPRSEDGKGSKLLLSHGKKNHHQSNFHLKHPAQRKETDPLSWLSAISCHSPGQDNKTTWWSHTWPTRVHILTNGTTGWLPHRNQSAEPARSQCHQESTSAQCRFTTGPQSTWEPQSLGQQGQELHKG